MEVIDIYINLWRQIANEFKDYNEYLIFESMDEIYFYDYNNYIFDYTTLTLDKRINELNIISYLHIVEKFNVR